MIRKLFRLEFFYKIERRKNLQAEIVAKIIAVVVT
jgi:hypothetical protein